MAAAKVLQVQKAVGDVIFRKASVKDLGKLQSFIGALPQKMVKNVPMAQKITCEKNLAGADISWGKWLFSSIHKGTTYVAEDDEGNVISTARFSIYNEGNTALLSLCLGDPNHKGVFAKLNSEAWKHYLSQNPHLMRIWGEVPSQNGWDKRKGKANCGKANVYEGTTNMKFLQKKIPMIPVCINTPKEVLGTYLPDIEEVFPWFPQGSDIFALKSENELKEILADHRICAQLFPADLLGVSYVPHALIPENSSFIYPQTLPILTTRNWNGVITAISFATPYESPTETILDVDFYGVEGSYEICKHLQRHIMAALQYGSHPSLTCRLFVPGKMEDVETIQEDIQKYLRILACDELVDMVTYMETSVAAT